MSHSFPAEAHPHDVKDIVRVRETSELSDGAGAPAAEEHSHHHPHQQHTQEQHQPQQREHAKPAPSAALMEHVTVAQNIIRDIFDRFPASEIGISFNGGKDSVVMFELIRRTVSLDLLKQCCIFVVDLRDEFDEILDFRARYMREVGKELTLLHQEVTVDMRDSMWKLMEKRPLKAIFMGTRKTDPHGKYQQSPVQVTTAGWPDFLRVCPLFCWSVHSVWEYTRLNHIPQCPLYEDGYTSLGNVSNTSRNPQLRKEDGTYRPAWELPSPDDERCGRNCHC